MNRPTGDCHVCGVEETSIHLLAVCDRCRAAAGRFRNQPGVGTRKSRRGQWEETFCCSFCGRGPKDVRKIFSGPWSFICDGCVALAVEAMREELGEGWNPLSEPVRADHVTAAGHAPSPVIEHEITSVGPAPSAEPSGGRRSTRRR